MRPDLASPTQWTAALLIGAAAILLLYNTLPVALAYPKAGTTAPRRRSAARLGRPGAPRRWKASERAAAHVFQGGARPGD